MIGTLTAIALAASAGSSIASAAIQSHAANTAAKTQTDAANQAIALQREQYQNAQRLYAPYIQRGNLAGDAMTDFLGLTGTHPGALPAGSLLPPMPSRGYPAGMGAPQTFQPSGAPPVGQPAPATLAGYAGAPAPLTPGQQTVLSRYAGTPRGLGGI